MSLVRPKAVVHSPPARPDMTMTCAAFVSRLFTRRGHYNEPQQIYPTGGLRLFSTPNREMLACCCFACGCVLELVVCRVRFARVSCPWLRFDMT